VAASTTCETRESAPLTRADAIGRPPDTRADADGNAPGKGGAPDRPTDRIGSDRRRTPPEGDTRMDGNRAPPHPRPAPLALLS
jgi:hypothetical protein